MQRNVLTQDKHLRITVTQRNARNAQNSAHVITQRKVSVGNVF